MKTFESTKQKKERNEFSRLNGVSARAEEEEKGQAIVARQERFLTTKGSNHVPLEVNVARQG